MIAPELRDALLGAVGRPVLGEHAPVRIDGIEIGATLRPTCVSALAAGLRVLDGRGGSALVRGGATRLSCGNRLRQASVVIDTRGLEAIRELDAEDGVACFEAGTRLEAARTRAREAGWELPLDPPGSDSTLGGVLAAAATGPCFGHPRDAVLGLEVVLASGEVTRCGGRVVKNVTGYDLAKLHLGAFGSLGVIASAWLRLRPLPERVLLCTAPVELDASGLSRTLAAARLSTARAAALLSDPPPVAPDRARRSALLAVELAGDAAAVDADRRRLTLQGSLQEADPALLERIRELQGSPAPEGGLRFRIAALPSRLAEAMRELRRRGFSLLVYPERGVLYAFARFDTHEPLRDLGRAWEGAEQACRRCAGHLLLESGPDEARAGREVFGDLASVAPLFRALKERFDPRGTLNAGRFAAGL